MGSASIIGMIHLLQSLADGSTTLVDVPVPIAGGASLVVESRATVVSAGTERMLVDFGRASWIEKARQQPEKVRQVLDKVRSDGLVPTIEAVRAKLDAPIPIGYCQAGVVVETGPRVERFAPGDRVVTNGPHAEYVRVAHTLAAKIPDTVGFEAAAFTPLAAIGLQGLRLAQPTLGETVVVYGLGLVGLLTVQLARANGCVVIGIDRAADRCALASQFGAEVVHAAEETDVAHSVVEMTGGVGADIVLLTLATDSHDPVGAAARMSRKRGRLVLVGVTGLALKREDFYRKELSFQVSCSYGPGRHDPTHEEKGIDYPLPFVRWTEARNFASVLGLIADGRLDPLPLVTHRFPVADAPRAYDVVSGDEPSLGIVITYPTRTGVGAPTRTVKLRSGPAPAGAAVIGFIGAGNFASRVLIPAFAAAGAQLETIASSGGVSAAVVGKASGFRRATTDAASLLTDPALDTIVVTTRHDSHADWAVRALSSGKNVFVEKPLALTLHDLARIRDALATSNARLCVGFNRRFAPLVVKAKTSLAYRSGALAISIHVNAGQIPAEHWTQDRESGGGRIVGEACHFIDLARFLVGSPIRDVGVVSAALDGARGDDVAHIQLAFEDGSIASVAYLANGPRAFPKERIELFFDGKAIRIDNFRRIEAWGVPGIANRIALRQDKGHAALCAAFVDAIRRGTPGPIPDAELFEVAEWSIRAGLLATHHGDV